MVKPAPFSFTILYFSDFGYKDLPRFADYIKKLKNTPGLSFTFISSKIFTGDFIHLDERLFTLELIKILNDLEIDGVVVDGSFLPLFQKMGREILVNSRFFFLGSNLFQRETEKSVFHPFLIKRMKGERILLMNILSDCPIKRYRDGYRWEEPKTYLGKKIPLLKERADFIGCFIDSQVHSHLPRFLGFFVLPDSGNWLIKGIGSAGGNIVEIKSEPMILTGEEVGIKERVQALTEKIDSILDIRIQEIKRPITPERIRKLILEFILKKTKVDFIIFDQSLIKEGIAKGLLTNRDLWEILNERGFLFAGEIETKNLISLLRDKNINIFPLVKGLTKKSYWVASPESIFRAKEADFKDGYFCLPLSLFEYVRDFFGGGSARF